MRKSIASTNHQGAAGSRIGGTFRNALIALAAAVALPGFAQQPAATNDSDQVIELPAVTVGATLRTEPLLQVPIAVSVVSGDQMLENNIRDISDVVEAVPSLTFRAGASNKDTSLLIRGVGTITTSPGTEPDVSTVVDGVVLARPGQATMDLMDIDHVEVLRGPQGTLFGKNSSVGAINIVTKDPTEKTTGYFDVSYLGGGGEEILHAGASGALMPKVLASVAVLFDDYNGNEQNIYLNEKVNSYRNWGTRAKVIYTPSTNLKATFIISYINSYATVPNEGPFVSNYNVSFPAGAVSFVSSGTLATIAPVIPYAGNTTVNSSLLGRVYDSNGGGSAQLEWTAGDYKVTSISAYQTWYNNQYEDTGTAPAPLVGQTVSHDKGYLWFDQYSEELRLTSPAGKLLEFVAGLYFQKAIDTETYRRDIVQEPTAGTLVPNFGEAHYGTHGNNMAVYGEGTWNFTKQFRMITGLRLTRDTLDFYHQRVASSAVAVPGIQPSLPIHSGDTQATGVSGRAGLQYDLDDEHDALRDLFEGLQGAGLQRVLQPDGPPGAPAASRDLRFD